MAGAAHGLAAHTSERREAETPTASAAAGRGTQETKVCLPPAWLPSGILHCGQISCWPPASPATRCPLLADRVSAFRPLDMFSLSPPPSVRPTWGPRNPKKQERVTGGPREGNPPFGGSCAESSVTSEMISSI
ncbi:unnamed protein product [Rangifer tarandus platyrhynchus]|uniref:Uncharacterized protein n=1 Tax=Rangifer tarandus platyrhynchus TaxID=3082113 RepID=A0AC59Z619_RANTA